MKHKFRSSGSNVPPKYPTIITGFGDPTGSGNSINLHIDIGSASVEEIRQVLFALNEVALAAGGSGFTFELDGDDGDSGASA